MVLGTCDAVEMDRQDSGYGECSARDKTTGSPQESQEESSSLQNQNPADVALTSSGRSSTRPQTLSRRSSINPSPRRGSNSYSRQSSFIINNPASGHHRRPHLRNSSLASDYDRTQTDDPFVAHKRSIQIFPSSQSSVGIQPPVRIEPQRRFTSPNPPKSPHASIPNIDGGSTRSETLPQYINYVPAANTDWTLPSTRLREYKKIDQSCQGIRGLWRRFAPRWCCKHDRLSFFEVDKGDTGSVRRYRMDLSKDQNDLKANSRKAEKAKTRPCLGKIRRWGHFTSRTCSVNQSNAKS